MKREGELEVNRCRGAWVLPQDCSAFVMRAWLWVPSPLEGEGQDEGEAVSCPLHSC
jgi:hypothetical protein